jgi:ABC-type nitrate/sulfonate/bicarbonate transport system permease component
MFLTECNHVLQNNIVFIHIIHAQLKGLIIENTFTSVEDMVGSVVPPLGALIGTGKPLNRLVTNKWYSLKTIPKIDKLPILMLSSGEVRNVLGYQTHVPC